jgi:hypothetical protein
MKEQKSALQLLKRYETMPFTDFEKNCLGLMLVFFVSMFFLFVICPKL